MLFLSFGFVEIVHMKEMDRASLKGMFLCTRVCAYVCLYVSTCAHGLVHIMSYNMSYFIIACTNTSSGQHVHAHAVKHGII